MTHRQLMIIAGILVAIAALSALALLVADGGGKTEHNPVRERVGVPR